MRLLRPSIVIETQLDGDSILRRLERAARTCYRSDTSGDINNTREFIKRILSSGHESVIEHESVTVRVICDRGVSHEIVRHRIASYSQESTRYCNYAKEKFGREISFIEPAFFPRNSNNWDIWMNAMKSAEAAYFSLIDNGAKPEEARSVLPNSLKTEIVITMNMREWRHFFRLRTAERAHPQMREVAVEILNRFKEAIPVLFDDI